MLAPLLRRTYRHLIALYPTELRREHGDDMAVIFDELIADRGVVAATTRTTVDLFVTVPRFRLEAFMTKNHATHMLNFVIAALVVVGIFGVTAGGTWVGAVPIVAGLMLAGANRGRLARSIRTPNPSQRSHRFRLAALNTAIFAVCVGAYMAVTWDGEASTPGLLIPTLLGTAALVGAMGFLMAGLFTPRTTNPALT